MARNVLQRDRVRGVLWSRKYTVGGRKPPRGVLKRLSVLWPMVRLDWEPTIGRWMLWEVHGRNVTALKIIEGAEGEYALPTIQNTIGWLGEACIRGRLNTAFDIDRWLGDIDDSAEKVMGAEQQKGRDRIHESSERLWSDLNRKSRIVRP